MSSKTKTCRGPNKSQSKQQKVELQQGRWTKEEIARFDEGYLLYGKKWKLIKKHVGTRSGDQIRSHAQKVMRRLGQEEVAEMEAAEG